MTILVFKWLKRDTPRLGRDESMVARNTKLNREVLHLQDEFDGKPVTQIAPGAFEGFDRLVEIVLPETITEIGDRAFADCTNLKKIVMPDGVHLIGSRAFAGCVSLEEVELPDQQLAIADGTFSGCTSLKEVGLPYGLEEIGENAFENCSALTTLYYFSKRGISTVMKTDRTLREDVLPTEIETVGARAFAGCSSLTKLTLPYKVTEVSPGCFEGCVSLELVEFHQRVTRIRNAAFTGCVALTSVRLPTSLKAIDARVFDEGCELVCESGSYVERYAAQAGLSHRAPRRVPEDLSSDMVPAASGEQHTRFYSDEVLDAAVERYEVRPPSFKTVDMAPRRDVAVQPSHFSYENGGYRGAAKEAGRARIMMVGDLMARARQLRAAATGGSGVSFDFSFRYVQKLLAQSDVAIGNLETTVSPSAPTVLEQEHVNSRPHLNAPEEFLAAVRKAGFDAVVNAQNHIYDSGTRGVFETLDLQNKHQLMHTGAFVSPGDQRFLVIDVGGIKVGVVSYLDPARQTMKRVNFTNKGRNVMFPAFDESRVAQDIAGARAAGAEFIIAYCHWGREYTHELTKRQRDFAQMVAEAGADYIFGAHPHCIQPFENLRTSTGRTVPCLFSGGNFLCDMNVKAPITRDTLIIDLELTRAADGSVEISNNTYHPCRIAVLSKKGGRDYAVVPTNGGTSPKLRASLEIAHARIVKTVGPGIKPAY